MSKSPSSLVIVTISLATSLGLFVPIANTRIEKVSPSVTLFKEEKRPSVNVVRGDARNLKNLKVSRFLEVRLLQTCSSDKSDLSNIQDYDEFVAALVNVYNAKI